MEGGNNILGSFVACLVNVGSVWGSKHVTKGEEESTDYMTSLSVCLGWDDVVLGSDSAGNGPG